jgi:hypothetical protein
MEIKVGDTVTFKDGLYADEQGATYRVIEVNGSRCFIEFICDMPIKPQSVALVSELDKVN